MEENSFNGTIITFDELKNAVKEGEVFLTPAEFAKKIKTSEKALRQMRWRSKKGLGTSSSIFADLLGTNNDADDLQILAREGQFRSTSTQTRRGRESFNLIYIRLL